MRVGLLYSRLAGVPKINVRYLIRPHALDSQIERG